MPPRTQPSIKKQVYDRIALLGTASKADLLKFFDLTGSSMTRLLEDMVEQGMIIVSGLGNSTGGRKPLLFRTNPTYRYILGLEISRLHSTLGLYDMHLTPLSQSHWTMDSRMTPDRLVRHVAEESGNMLARYGLHASQVLGIGIGAVGPLDRNNGVMLQPEFFPSAAWKDVPIRSMLEERLKLPAALDNGANTALLAEHWALGSGEIEHMLYVHAGVNLRFAALSGGRIIRGAIDTENAIGQMVVQAGGPRLRQQGNYGSLEAYVSLPALEDRVRAQLSLGRPSVLGPLDPETISYGDLAEALRRDDPLVREVFSEAAAYLGLGLANLINTLYPQYVILGGPLVNIHPLVSETAIQAAGVNTRNSSGYQPCYSLGKLKDDAVAAGAALMLLQEWEG